MDSDRDEPLAKPGTPAIECFLAEDTGERVVTSFLCDGICCEVEEAVYRRVDTGEVMRASALPPGAIWRLAGDPGFAGSSSPHGEHSLVVVTPGGLWRIEGRDAGCDMRAHDPDYSRHTCRVYTGVAPRITVHRGGGCRVRAEVELDGWRGRLIDGRLIRGAGDPGKARGSS